jgi:hypothetical protein
MASWDTKGNTAAPTDFLGTVNNQPLVIKTGAPITGQTNERLRIDVNGNVGIGNSVPRSPLQIKTLTALSEGATPAGAWANFGSNRYYDGSWHRIDPTKAGVNLHMNADDGVGEEFRFQRVEADGSNTRNIGTIGTRTSFIAEGNVGVGTNAPEAKLDVRGQASCQGPLSINNAATVGVGSPGDNRAAITFGATDTPAAYYLGAYTSDMRANTIFGLYSYQSNAWLQLWSPNGNVGIGTAPTGLKLSVNGGVSASALSVSGSAFFVGNVGIALTDDDERRGGEPSSPLVVHGDIEIIGKGNLRVSGDVLLTGADCAEDFDVSGAHLPDPGTVVVICEEGTLRESHEAYDKKVAGVVSGAGEYRHGLVLDKRSSGEGRIPVALVGKVYCKVDAQYSPVEVGDLLTTSNTPGHAMKATEPTKAIGSIIGKALKPLERGQGLIPILIALQ